MLATLAFAAAFAAGNGSGSGSGTGAGSGSGSAAKSAVAAAPAPAPPPKTSLFDHASAHRHLFQFDLTPISFGLPVEQKYAATFGVNLKNFAAIEAEYFGGSADDKLGDFSVASMKESILLARARIWPLSGHFNVFGGYGLRTLTADVLTTTAATRTKVVEAGVGHRWDLSVLTFGVDWLAVYVPVGESTVTVQDPLATMSDKDRQSTEDTLNKLKKFPTVALFKLYLGLNF